MERYIFRESAAAHDVDKLQRALLNESHSRSSSSSSSSSSIELILCASSSTCVACVLKRLLLQVLPAMRYIPLHFKTHNP